MLLYLIVHDAMLFSFFVELSRSKCELFRDRIAHIWTYLAFVLLDFSPIDGFGHGYGPAFHGANTILLSSKIACADRNPDPDEV